MTMEQQPSLLDDLQDTLNRHSAENGSNTPDHILAEYLIACLAAFDKAAIKRGAWYIGEQYISKRTGE